MFQRLVVGILTFFICTMAWASEQPTSSINTVLQLVNYVGADYPTAVVDGKVINQAEYAEMTEFSAQIKTLIADLPDTETDLKQPIVHLSDELSQLVTDKASTEDVYQTAQALNQLLIHTYNVNVSAPTHLPTRQTIEKLYMDNCASCHGDNGAGNGILAANLDPKPTNFHDHLHLDQLSVFALYNTINLGIADTAMVGFKDKFSDAERWGLAFYISSLGISEKTIEQGKKLWNNSSPLRTNLSSEQITSLSVLELSKKYSRDLTPAIFYVLQNPQLLQQQSQDLWQVTLNYMQQSFKSYEVGHYAQAYNQAINAYLEGFEGLEPTLDVVDHALRENLEKQMLNYRQLISTQAPFEEVQTAFGKLIIDLENAQQKLADSQMTWFKVFLSALIILLREGLEIILVVALVVAMLVKAERRDALVYVHIGWISALIAGFATWFISHKFIAISGMQRELTEGLTTLLAAAMLFWVGFWLHSKNVAGQWQQFIKQKLDTSLSRGSLIGLSTLCFIAVYREMFETILFYETLWLQANGSNEGAIYYGFGAALLGLVCLVYLILRVGIKLPIATFFRWSSSLLFILAFIFVGQGIHSLEEAGKVVTWPVDFVPTISMLGIFPNVIGLACQLGLVIMTVVLLRWKDK